MTPGELCGLGSFCPDFSLTGVSEAGRTDSSPNAMPLVSSKRFVRHGAWHCSTAGTAGFRPNTLQLPSSCRHAARWKRGKPYTAALAMPADGVRQSIYHTLFGLIAVTGMRIRAMGLERDVDLDVGVLKSSRKVLSRDPTRCAACARHARTLPNGLKCLPAIVPVERQSRQAISDEDR